ncbi:hypothetical protein [Streptomyces zaomyceticus]|uniref:hypothetical protein n=1 Tax=Streptomyces zaomyceticus TaxID=68286 RepID=UPI0033A7D70F
MISSSWGRRAMSTRPAPMLLTSSSTRRPAEVLAGVGAEFLRLVEPQVQEAEQVEQDAVDVGGELAGVAVGTLLSQIGVGLAVGGGDRGDFIDGFSSLVCLPHVGQPGGEFGRCGEEAGQAVGIVRREGKPVKDGCRAFRFRAGVLPSG